MKYINGDYYNRIWENDKKNGDGIIKYSNGEKYIGNWINDKKIKMVK